MGEQQDSDRIAAHKTLDELRQMRWAPKYHGEVPNESAPDGKVDMWILVDDETGDGIVTIGLPPGRSDIAGYIAACCGNPVRWVTSMWRPDPQRDGLDDPEDVLGKQTREIGDVLFGAYNGWLERNGGQSNGWTLNDALAYMWYAFCGQLSHDMRGRLLFKFMQLATTDGDKLMADQPAPEQADETPPADIQAAQEVLRQSLMRVARMPKLQHDPTLLAVVGLASFSAVLAMSASDEKVAEPDGVDKMIAHMQEMFGKMMREDFAQRLQQQQAKEGGS